MQQNVGLVPAREPFDGRAINADALGKRTLNFCGSNRDRFECSDDIGEPEPHKFDAALLDGAQYEVTLLIHEFLFCHDGTSLFLARLSG